MYRLTVANLACFTAWRWRLAELAGSSWRLAVIFEGPGGGPYFCVFLWFSSDCCLGCETPMLQ